ncbi:hypothetical protein BKA67DRAFT_563653 [Truncatella angustata]|uniref:Uncharacterized protein n=1 Tax=Truncatella angustata TaxID=152316 RepID=A0A9P8UL10_9PEZI|nr:uncharacterized protein BKA67DRAFT_563653 [Truncatella angustata]KAH6653925.1 hypothetical protein BKA67DRAFT_563653 [Truncatella angustata]
MAADAAAPKANSTSPQGEPDEWSEEQIQDALEQLKMLHIKCRELRTTVPRMLEPLTSRQTTQQDALVSFRKSVENAANEMQDFKTLYNSDETSKVFGQAKKSRQAQPKDIKAWRARDHPDWLDMKEKKPTT